MALPKSGEEAAAAVRLAAAEGVAPFFLGNGSNLLVADGGFDGFILKTTGLEQTREVNRRLRAECGIPLARLAMAALGRGLTGLEFAHGIPGTLGGAVMMNAGAYGGEMVQVLTSVTYLDEAGTRHTLPAGACGLSYRHSLFCGHPEWLILEAEMALPQGEGEQIRGRMEWSGPARAAPSSARRATLPPPSSRRAASRVWASAAPRCRRSTPAL